MAVVKETVVNELMEASDDIRELVEGNGGLPVLWTTATEWFQNSMNEDLMHDKQLMREVNSGFMDDLDAPWVIGNKEDWMDFLKGWAKEVKYALNQYEKGFRGEELSDRIAGE